jgi:hypothetical protein
MKAVIRHSSFVIRKGDAIASDWLFRITNHESRITPRQ